jgi:hypothetical protein
MNPRRCCFASMLLLATAWSAQAQPVSVPALGPRYKQTHERIEALFQYRNGTYALPDTKLNPFRSGELAMTQPTPDLKREQPPQDSDDAVLRRAISMLQLARMEFGGVSILVANQKPFKAGETMPVRFRDRTVQIVVKDITPAGVTLVYGTAESFQSFAAQKQ